MRRTPLSLLAWLVAVAVWMTWAPFQWGGDDHPRYLLELELDHETAAHLLLYVPIAIVLTAMDRGVGMGRFLRVIGWVTLLSAALELGQWWIDLRAVSPYDFLAGVVGAVPAVIWTSRVSRRGMRRGALLLGTAAVVFALVVAAFSYSVIRQHAGLILEGWNPGFEVVAGDEVGGGRPYSGRVEAARICGGKPGDRVCIEPGAAPEQRQELARRAEAGQRLQVSATITSGSDEQRGPARIVTFSDGPYFRNVTLGQTRTHLELRLRTPRGGSNGIDHTFLLPRAVTPEMPTRVEARFDRGSVHIVASSAARRVAGHFVPLLRYSLHVRGQSTARFHAFLKRRALLVGAVIVFAGLGLAVGWIGGRRWGRCLLAAPLLAAGYLAVLDRGLDGTLAPGLAVHAIAVGAAAIGVIGAVLDRRRSI